MTAGKIHKYVVCIAGPTAVGKTAAAVRLAKYYDTEIISADSRQIYRQMQIGTAKPTPEELQGIKCHFIDHRDIGTAYSAGDFEREALAVIEEVHRDRDVVVVAGGTGFYHKALLEGFDKLPVVPDDVKTKWNNTLAENGLEYLQAELRSADPDYYEKVDLNNPVRLIRALSVIEVSGKPFSSFHTKEPKERPFRGIRIFMNMERKKLYERIEKRVDEMVKAGLVEEVRALLPHRNEQALQTVGYRELFPYFDGQSSLEQAISKIKQHSRNYAKRQVTWYRNQGDWEEVDALDYEGVLRTIESQMLL